MLTALVDLVLPRSCAGCLGPGAPLCPGCRGLLTGPLLGRVRPDPCPEGLPVVFAVLAYEGVAQRLLLSHKEKGRLSLTRPLGEALASAVRAQGAEFLPWEGEPIVLCPVPSAPKAVRQRGHDHAMRLARAAACALRARGIDVRAARLLVPARRVADQSGLTITERAANVAGALRGVGAPCRVVVVDDVMTTGATLVEGARALREAGHRVVGASVIAATSRQRVSPRRTSPLLPRTERG